jgi:hypothetical protein
VTKVHKYRMMSNNSFLSGELDSDTEQAKAPEKGSKLAKFMSSA